MTTREDREGREGRRSPFEGRTTPRDPQVPSVSVVVCTFNDEEVIGECLRALVGQTYPEDRLELIVVDDGSTDGTAGILSGFPTIRRLEQRHRGPSVARNLGVVAARGEIVCCIDSDCRAAPDWVERLIDGFQFEGSERWCGIGGRQESHPEDPPFARRVGRFLSSIGFIGDYVKPFSGPRTVGHNAACNVAYRRRPLVEAGGFRPGMFPGEDVDLDRRLGNRGWSVRFVPDAVVFHHRPAGWGEFVRMVWRYGRASADNVTIHGFFRTIQWVPPIILALTVGFGAALLMIGLDAVPIIGVFVGLGVIGMVVRGGVGLVRSAPFVVVTVAVFTVSFWVRVAANAVRPSFDTRRELCPLSFKGDTDDEPG